MWIDDLHLYLLSDSKDSVSLFDLASGAATAPPAIADSATHSQWLTRDAAARLAIRNHLPLPESAHFRQHRTAQALYAAVPPMFITLYFIVTRLPDTLRSVKDHFLSLDPTSLAIDLLEQHLLATETSAVAVDVSVAEDVGPASAGAKCRSCKGKGGKGGGGGSGGGGGGSGSGGEGSSRGTGGSGGGGGGGTGGGSGGSGGGGGGSGGSGCNGGGGTGGGRAGPGHLLRSLPPLPPSPAPPCLPCVEGRQRAAPHSSSFPPTTAPLQTLHMDVCGPARVSGQGRERYFLLVVDDYTWYTTVFPMRSKGEVVDVLIPWIRTVHLQLRERFSQDLPVLRLHSDRGVMEVARTSMIHAASPHFLWPFAVRYAPHQLNLWPRVSLPETSPTLRWTGEVGDASVSRVWGSRAFVCDTSADKLSARAIPCVFLGFVPDAPGWQFYHPTSHRVLPSQDVTFDESVPFYRLFPYHSAPPPPPPLSLAPGPPPVAVGSGAARGAASGGAASGGAEPGSSGSEGAGSGGAEPGGTEPRGAASSGGPAGASPRLSPQQLGEWLIRRAHLWSGATRAGDIGDAGAGGAGVTAGAGGTGGTAAARPRGARTEGAGAAGTAGGAGIGGTGAGGAGAAGAGAVDPRAGGAGGIVRPSLTERRKPASRPVKPVRTARRVPRSRPPPVPGMHAMALRPSSAPLRVPLPAPPASSLLEVPDPASDCARTAVIDPSFESAAASALVAELLDFAASCRLDYATAVVAESASPSPLSVGDPDAPDIPTPRSYAEAITGPYSSQCQAAMDAEMAS
ncbi:unnamed protein product [Closterium sp. NIES-54]